ncbi:SH3 domain-containing protein [Ruania alba]|nr:SH3 domain-containing protein [Ruania alba]
MRPTAVPATSAASTVPFLDVAARAPGVDVSRGRLTSRVTIQTTAPLNLRQRATASSTRLATLPRGAKVTSIYRASNGWYKVTYRGRTGYVSHRYVIRVTSSTSARSSSSARIPTAHNQRYAGLSYATIDGGVDWSRRVGMVIFLDGDYYRRGYSQAVSEHTRGATAAAMAEVAARDNKILVIPRIPRQGYISSLGYTWWGRTATNAVMLRKLDQHLRRTGNITRSRTVYMGYSGGAEFITYELARRSQGSYGYGGAILLAGGGGRSDGRNIRISTPPSSFTRNFDMHWFVGSKDGVGQSSNAQSWSAYTASAQGRSLYKSKGFRTSRTVLRGQDHHSYNLASVLEAGLKKVK